jgi:Cytochrome P460
MKRNIGLTLLAGLCCAFGVAIGNAKEPAMGSKIVFPENFAKGVMYTTIDRADNKQYRELFSTPEAIDALKAGKVIPSGTVLTLVQYKAKLDAQGNPEKDGAGRFIKSDLIGYAVMEKRSGWGAEYGADIRNGEWDYQAFTADKAVNEKANLRNCFVCHKPLETQDYVFSVDAMKNAKK